MLTYSIPIISNIIEILTNSLGNKYKTLSIFVTRTQHEGNEVIEDCLCIFSFVDRRPNMNISPGLFIGSSQASHHHIFKG